MSAHDEELGYHPDARPKGEGLDCFLNMDRLCNASCMAFQTDRPQGAEYNGQWAHCMLLTNAHKGAKHLIVLAQCAGQMVKQHQDSARTSQVAPGIPGVR